MKLIKNDIKKILIIKLRGIGDVVLSTIVFDNLLEEFPNAKIDFLTEKPGKEVIKGLDFINNILIFNRSKIIEKIKTAFKIRRNAYDMILDFFSNPSTAQMTFFSGARYRVGFPYKGRKYAYNMFGPPERGKYHSAVLHLMVLKNIGLFYRHNKLYFYLDEAAYYFINKYINTLHLNNKILVGVCPSGGWESKKCDPDILAKIADELVEKFNCSIILLWGPGDKNDTDNIYNKMHNKPYYAPSTSLKELGALISKCNIFISNDSGPMHISTAVGTPTLSLHGPTNPELQGPYGEQHSFVRLDELDCIGCNLLKCPREHECFKNLPLDRIIQKFKYLAKINNISIDEKV